MAATSNSFGELLYMGSLEPYASRKEILAQLEYAEELEREEEEALLRAQPQSPTTKLARFSEDEIVGFEAEGWSIVQPRERGRSLSGSQSEVQSETQSEVQSDQSVEVAPRALPVPFERPVLLEEIVEAPAKTKTWKFVRWGAYGVLGALALAKVCVRR